MPQTLAELVRTLRSAARLSQEALAEAAGLSTRTVSDIETGFAKTPRLVTLMLLAEGLGLSEADRTRLQDAARKPGAGPSADAGAPPPLRTIALVGRDSEVRDVTSLVLRADVRMVTICGPAGVGKTALALRAASECAHAFTGGCAFAELAPIDDPALAPSVIALALGLRAGGETVSRAAVAAALRARPLLLVFDNLEHLTPLAVWLSELLDLNTATTMLVTSREALHLRAEHIYPLKPLAAQAATALFVRRAQGVIPEFTLSSANEAAVASIVAHLEGLPLAIELAAPRLRVLPPKALAARLARRLPLLEDGAVDLPVRQQTMRSAIAWSYDLLAPAEQSTFRNLGVLVGGGSLEAVRAVLAIPEAEGAFVQRLATLIEKSLLSLEEDAEGEPRVSMLEMLREFAAEQLAASDEAAAARERHARWVLEFLQTAQASIGKAEQPRWIERLEREHPNIRAALQWAHEAGDVELGVRMLAAVWRFWWLRGYLHEGLGWMHRFLDGEPAQRIPSGLRAKALRAFVVLLSAAGAFDEALAPCEEAIRLQREAGDETELCATLTSLGIIRQFQGDLDGAAAIHHESLAIRRRIGDETGIANSLSNLSSIAFSKGDLRAAEAFAEESVANYRRTGHTSGMSRALMNLGLVAAQERRFERAERMFEACLELHRELGNTASLFYPLTNLASVALKRGDVALALTRYRSALDALDAVPNKAAISSALEGLACALVAAGEPRRAAHIFGAVDTLRTAIGSPRFPAEQEDYDAGVAAARAALGDGPFATERQIGTSMSIERAVEEAREGNAQALR